MTGIVPEQRQTIGEASSVGRSLSRPFLIAATIVLLLGLPSLVYYLSFCLAFNLGQLMLPSAQMLHHLPLPTAASIGLVVGWIVFHGLLQIYAPGKWVNGVPLPNGKRLKYKINGWTSWWAMWALLAAAVSLHFFSPATLADEFGTLLITANIVSYLLSLFLYWYYKRGTQQQGIGSAILDFWLGTALNPRIGTFDLKLFFEARPGSNRLGRARPVIHDQTIRAPWFCVGADDPRMRISFLVRHRLFLARRGDPDDLGHQTREFRLDALLGGLGLGAVHVHRFKPTIWSNTP